jgi:DeoR/GlpR family transcriptional regulator of sugar metabolism
VLAAERRDLMTERLRRDGRLVARDLAIEFGLTEDSVRRDLRDLAAAGLCQRVYGGALRTGAVPDEFTARLAVAPEPKRLVAQRAAKLITPGSTAVLGGGTTNLAVAHALAPNLRATVIAVCPKTAAALLEHSNVDVFVLGGRLSRVNHSVSGAAAAEALSTISADLLLLAGSGVHAEEGVTTSDPDEAAMARLLVAHAADTFILASSEKLGNVQRHRVVRVRDVAGIVTDAPYEDPTVRQLRKQNVNIIYAS